MVLGKRIPTVGLVFNFVLGLLFSVNCWGQTPTKHKSFGLIIESGYSGSVDAAGVSVVYAGAPFFTDLELVKQKVPNYSVDLFKNYNLTKILFVEQSIGYSSYGHITKYNYDLANSINNIVEDKRKYRFLDLTHRIKAETSISRKISLLGFVGVSFNYLTKISAEYTNYVNGSFNKGIQNRIDMEPRFSFGYEVGGGVGLKMSNNVALQIRTSYVKLLSTYNTNQRRLYSYGLGIGVIKAF